MQAFVLGSGSSGNCIVLESEGERVVLDAGVGPQRAVLRMRALGGELVTQKAPLGIFVTHEHGDHSAQASPLARALRAPLFAHDRNAMPRERKRLGVQSYLPGQVLRLGPFSIESMAVPHDAPQVALRVSSGRRTVALATDVGHAGKALRGFLAGSDLVFLESNYCPHMLAEGPYPERLKSRVAGPLGHLSNEQAAEIAASLDGTQVSRLVLVHLSLRNNSPKRALDVVSRRAGKLAVEALPHGEPRRYGVGTRGPAQLSLGF